MPLVFIAGPAASPGQCETDTKTLSTAERATGEERRGKASQARSRIVLSSLPTRGRAGDHEVITYVFNSENQSKERKVVE